MNRKKWKFFIIIGILLVIASIVLYPYDPIIALLGVVMGVYNVFKGIRLKRGIQPLIIREQQKRERALNQEVRDKMDNADNPSKK